MPWIVLTRKAYHDQKERPSPIRDGGKLCNGGWTIPISDDSGGPFGGGGKRPPRGGNSGPPRGGNNNLLEGGDNELSGDQNPRPYVVRSVGPWIGPNLEFVVPFMVSYPTPYSTKSSTK